MATLFRYVKEKRGHRLQECGDKVDQYQREIREFGITIERVREAIAKIDKEINESGASVANLRENIRVRRLIRDIKAAQAEIDSYDMEEAAKARRTFKEKYQGEKDKETEMQSKVFIVLHLVVSSF
jgi:DNA repair protein RAD50